MTMTTTIDIDHREWKDWRSTEDDGAIGKLNALLLPHGVQVEVLNDDSCDYLELRAVSLGLKLIKP